MFFKLNFKENFQEFQYILIIKTESHLLRKQNLVDMTIAKV